VTASSLGKAPAIALVLAIAGALSPAGAEPGFRAPVCEAESGSSGPRVLRSGFALASRFACVPARDDAVLETLPQPLGTSARALRALRLELAAWPGDLAVATRVARRYLDLARAEGDPRFQGWAEGALAPWWAQDEPPDEVLLLRATIRQSRHAFDDALADLAKLVARDPLNVQAWLGASLVHQARGDPRAASRSCAPLLRAAPELVAATCLAGAAGLSRNAARAAGALRDALDAAPGAAPEERAFAFATLAELEARRGRSDEAERAFLAALDAVPRAPGVLARYADLLLDVGRSETVAARLGGETRDDGLLLRLALAEGRLGLASAGAHRDQLRARFEAARLRGEALHRGEEARFRLELEGEPREALRLARENFAVQREPRDARTLLEAALAAGEPAAAEPALAWLHATGLEDAAIAPLVARLAALR
jgi:Tfp pilus assembly protein PilF